ncbi:glutaredoxin [Natronocella acetinitrilica]|uniref:Glutaredoxin n=1 Tax=Natronocella acetinitrilica TaxID=414046 RepID=A0AAE3G7F3_9GAMM|nr:glutathione S-transferase N-terminal domain-containing protein [Natronocella acetinitrilica]MCP1677064.1 glutaredoxin [Natronocella acetinitrilica]
MKIAIRYFFRGVRAVLTPVILGYEKLTTPKPIDRAPTEQAELDKAGKQLVLYQFQACPFCMKVRKEMARLGLTTVEMRDARNDSAHRAALEAGGGKVKVPCLLIHHEDGQQEWMYESDAINAWLADRFDAPSTN